MSLKGFSQRLEREVHHSGRSRLLDEMDFFSDPGEVFLYTYVSHNKVKVGKEGDGGSKEYRQERTAKTNMSSAVEIQSAQNRILKCKSGLV